MKQQLHILLVSYEFPPEMATGGIGSYINHLASLLHHEQQHVTVFSATIQQEEVTVINRAHCVNYLIPAIDPETFRKKVLPVFEQFASQNQVDVIESPEVGACAIEIKKRYPGIPLVVKMHTPGVLITKVSNTYQPFISKLRYVTGALRRGKFDLGYWANNDKNKERDPEFQICEMADLLLTPSEALKQWAVSFWRLPAEKIEVIANPFHADTDLLHYPIERYSKTICFIGKLTVLKGMFAFTGAIKKVLLKHPDYRILLVGRDEAASENIPSMQKWMEDQLTGVTDRVIFKGALNRDSVKQVLSECEICVVPSLWENYPTVVLEAMAAGCAVAASNRGGIPELITDQQNGLLFNPMNENSIYSAIDELINAPSFRFRMAIEGRKKITEETAQDILKEQIMQVYRILYKQPENNKNWLRKL